MRKKILCLLTALVMAFPFLCAAQGEEACDMDRWDFSCQMADGSTFTLSEQKGKVVLINFWATWCGPCVYEMPALNDLGALYADSEDVCVVTVNCGDRASVVRTFMEQKGFTLPVVCDERNQVCGRWGIMSIPTTVIFDRTGSIRDVVVGVRLDVSEICTHYAGVIESLLAEEEAACEEET